MWNTGKTFTLRVGSLMSEQSEDNDYTSCISLVAKYSIPFSIKVKKKLSDSYLQDMKHSASTSTPVRIFSPIFICSILAVLVALADLVERTVIEYS